MANHNLNRIFVSDRVRADLEARFRHDGEQSFDFNDFIPMPNSIYRGELGEEELKIYGEDNWYSWSLENWNTKWNCYWCNWEDEAIEFYTAWSAPTPIFLAISKLYPGENISVYCEDEGGWYAYEATYRNGEEIQHNDCTDEVFGLGQEESEE